MISCLPAGPAAAASAGGARVIGQRLQPGRDLLVRLHQQVQHVTCDVLVLLVEERCCQTYKEMFVSALLVFPGRPSDASQRHTALRVYDVPSTAVGHLTTNHQTSYITVHTEHQAEQ